MKMASEVLKWYYDTTVVPARMLDEAKTLLSVELEEALKKTGQATYSSDGKSVSGSVRIFVDDKTRERFLNLYESIDFQKEELCNWLKSFGWELDFVTPKCDFECDEPEITLKSKISEEELKKINKSTVKS